MTDGPLASGVGEAMAAANQGLAEHAEIWRSAISRNAAGEYRAEDALADWQALWGLALRDASAVWTAMFDVVDRRRPDSDGDES